ncbi:hypothetical protein EMIHUDRAFT_207426 [Emiliania huxleyi CCMP1516]|uniref:DNA2/NAM7 helicase-like C-terminal domain-containing protein n=2 Tax=Emiliania huxleyi TaxID=2903 RepID=A0A0D3JFG2_EMIH1|nr:hypothetical protein EMIHUDRAFT_207426 [Emiliania huxleyi CCMP1516]EOD22247.1 hypothetical protein EMIHUDRAFT_207426 [Emiliania huxleyi CCMP1516]|eukprot:XP_005774676.1 hypothetical protein EMIHUDRAFT_207426 [Emiliania huxleyi CCMP1516]
MISAGGPLLSKLGPFHAILVDEVAQATEPATLVPVLARGCSQLVLCGDHFQLPPSCASREALARGLGLSGYERLVSQGTEPLCLGTVMEPFHDPSWHLPAGVEPLFLDTQFRAHPKLMDFSCDAIYGGRLRSGIDSRRIDAAARPAGGAAEHAEGESRLNRAEATRLMGVLEGLLAGGDVDCSQVGVVTPYKGQAGRLEIASVDNFQGREKEVVLFSAVRANSHGAVGFLSDWRRLNVLLTRARRGLVVVGHQETLRHDPYWRRWLDFAARERVIVDRREWLATLRRAAASDTAAPLCELLSAAAAGWRGWAAEVREALSAAGGEAGWKGVRKTLLARHAATHRRVGGQAAALRDAARDAVPAELWVKRGVRLALPEGDAARRFAMQNSDCETAREIIQMEGPLKKLDFAFGKSKTSFG